MHFIRLPAKANPMARPRFELKYELTAIKDDGFINPNPNPEWYTYQLKRNHWDSSFSVLRFVVIIAQ